MSCGATATANAAAVVVITTKQILMMMTEGGLVIFCLRALYSKFENNSHSLFVLNSYFEDTCFK